MEIDKQKSKPAYKKKIRGIESYSSIIFKTVGISLLLLAVYYYFETDKSYSLEQLSKILTSKSNNVNNGNNLKCSFLVLTMFSSFGIIAKF